MRSATTVIRAVGITAAVVAVVGMQAAAQAAPAAKPASSTSSLKAVAEKLATESSHGGGSLSSPQGQQILRALRGTGSASRGGAVVIVRSPAQRSPNTVTPPPGGGGGSLCTGTFNDTSAVVTLSESATGIPWGVRLTAANADLGEIAFSAQIYADGYQANTYSTHVEFWDYFFHATLPNPFQVLGASYKHKMTTGSQVSFLWYWNSTAHPSEGGYAYVNCTYYS